jgi:DNA recombination protein RmuC
MNSLGNRLKQAQVTFDDANNKLSNGRGHLVGQAQKLRQLGVKPTKSLSPALVDGAYESDELPFVLESDAAVTPPETANGRARPSDLMPTQVQVQEDIEQNAQLRIQRRL